MLRRTLTETEFPVSVVLERREKQRDQWRFTEWKATGVLTGAEHFSESNEPKTIHVDDDHESVLWSNFYIRLNKDGAESYWNNLMADHPSLFVVCRREDDGENPEPFLVTVNYDEIIGYQEVDDDVYRLPMPPDIYRWLEQYVVNNYVPPERKKRKRKNWSETDGKAPYPGRRH